MSSSPLFSVIIPTYKRPSQLADCLRALTLQAFPLGLFEVIVVDDDEGISTLDGIISSFHEKLRLTLVRQPNSGPAKARNLGASVSSGQFLVFTDDDCEPDPKWLAMFHSRLGQVSDCMVGGKIVNRLTGNLYASASQLIIDAVYEYYNKPEGAVFFTSNNIMVPACRFFSLGGFDGVNFPKAAEDRDLCRRWRESGYRCLYEPGAAVYHSHHLTFITFCRQHFNYGRGAARFHRSCTSGENNPAQAALGFHLNPMNWLLHPFKSEKGWKAIKLCSLLALWQALNLAGFSFEIIRMIFSMHKAGN